MAVAGEYKAIICEFVLQEAKRVIRGKFSDMEDDAVMSLDLLLRSAEKYPLLSSKEVSR
ncbi:hypothetical protein [Halarsenatibacter silvermanii]|uniref:hypothetical protein n=1 Tax=Halarsenatibacter silvermanii TaxID=321763 RepID=UPI00135670DA|nr:hypothetical protein [Halarsenatibacter silvermanii]